MTLVSLQVPSIEFNVSKLPMTDDVSSTWATIISLASHNFKAERDNREMDKTPMASSTLTVESEGKLPGFLVAMATNKINYSCLLLFVVMTTKVKVK